MTPPSKESHGLFRKTIHLDRVPDRAPARITADSRYALFVNGGEVFRGPIRNQPRRIYYDLFDLAPFLQPGANVSAVYVKYYGTPKSFWQPAVPNMTLPLPGQCSTFPMWKRRSQVLVASSASMPEPGLLREVNMTTSRCSTRTASATPKYGSFVSCRKKVRA